MDTGAERCAVVEDIVSGVIAGLAAGMAVFAFAGGVTNADLLSIEGATVFDDMTELPALLRPPSGPLTCGRPTYPAR
jgi:beta-phosphoglucomutase-like phosphatase (HAD superfamily)